MITLDRRTSLRILVVFNLLLLGGLYSVHTSALEGERLGALFTYHGNGGVEQPRHAEHPSQRPVSLVPQCGFCEAGEVGRALCDRWGEGMVRKAQAYGGSGGRLKHVLARVRSGQPISVGVVGGSISAGHGIHNASENMHKRFFDHLDRRFPSSSHLGAAYGEDASKEGGRNVFFNDAQPARGSDYFSMCAQNHLHDDVDLVVVELAINDQAHTSPLMTFENLIRALLELPSQPAVIIVNTFTLAFHSLASGGDVQQGIAQYYDVPVLSTRNVLLPIALANHSRLAEWFVPSKPWLERNPETLENVDLRHFAQEPHNLAGDLMSAYVDQVLCEMDLDKAHRDAHADEISRYPLEPVPRVRLQDAYKINYEFPKLQPLCMTTDSTRSPLKPKRQSGWRSWSWKDKHYLVAEDAGASITFEFSTQIGEVVLYYLRSWEFPMGNLNCWIDDNKNTAKVCEGRWEDKKTKLNIGRTTVWRGIAPGKHELNCEVMQKTDDPSGGHEFRLMSLMSL